MSVGFAKAARGGFAEAQASWQARDSDCSDGRLWPLVDQGLHVDHSIILNALIADVVDPFEVGEIGVHHAGIWECNLVDQSLIWSGGVYDIFGLERSTPITRARALSCYSEDSRVKLERLRSHAISHSLGFTLDVEICAAAVRETRHLRLIGAPLFEGETAIRLRGVKLLI
jgi:hypothetical protein